MGKRYTCLGCSQPFPLSELHIDPATSDWYCDPCYQMMMMERIDPSDNQSESYETDDED